MKFKHVTIKTKNFVSEGADPRPVIAIDSPSIGRKHIILQEFTPDGVTKWASSRHHSDATRIPLMQLNFSTDQSDSDGHLGFASGMEFAFRIASVWSQLTPWKEAAFKMSDIECIMVLGDQAGRHVVVGERDGSSILTCAFLVGLAFEVKD